MTVGSVPTSAVLDGFDLTDLDTFSGGFPHDAFVTQRRVAPVLWPEPTRLELAGTPERTRGNKHSGLRHVPLRWNRAETRS